MSSSAPTTTMLRVPLTNNHSISLFMYDNVINATQILEQVRSKPQDQPALISILSPHLCVSLLHIYLSAFKSVQSQERQSLRTKNIETELLLNMCASRNLGEAFRLFGIKEDSTCLIVVIFNQEDGAKKEEEAISYMQQLIQGNVVPVDQMESLLKGVCDRERVIKAFKLSPHEKATADIELEQHVLSRLAIRDL